MTSCLHVAKLVSAVGYFNLLRRASFFCCAISSNVVDVKVKTEVQKSLAAGLESPGIVGSPPTDCCLVSSCDCSKIVGYYTPVGDHAGSVAFVQFKPFSSLYCAVRRCFEVCCNFCQGMLVYLDSNFVTINVCQESLHYVRSSLTSGLSTNPTESSLTAVFQVSLTVVVLLAEFTGKEDLHMKLVGR